MQEQFSNLWIQIFTPGTLNKRSAIKIAGSRISPYCWEIPLFLLKRNQSAKLQMVKRERNILENQMCIWCFNILAVLRSVLLK